MSEKQILIADADPKAWEEVRQALGEGWTVVGAATGGAAMAQAQKQPFDVVVAKHDLAEVDGAELLNRLRETHPQTLRFIAADAARREEVMAQIQGRHEFLTIPFERAMLKSIIERSVAEECGMSQNMRDLVGRIRTFPTLPSLYLEVVNALKNPHASTEDIGLIIAKDMAMTTKLVQVLNSAYFGLPRTISDPTEAVGILGFETVKSLIMTVKLLSQYDKVKPVYFSIDNIWKHSTNVARAAKTLALLETGDAACSGHAYTAGLMHDVGKVILAANFDEQYNGAHRVARKQQVPLWEVEKDIFGASHGEIGAYLLGRWGMSEEVIKVATLHHHPLHAGDTSFTALTAVHVANALEYEGNSETDGLPCPVVDAAYLQQLGLEGRLDRWRDAQRDPAGTAFETKAQRAKSATKSATKPAAKATKPVNSMSAPAPKANDLSLQEAPPSSFRWGSLSRWAGLGLGVSAVLALLVWWGPMQGESAPEKPRVQMAAKPSPPMVNHEVAKVAAPAKPVPEAKPAPPPSPPVQAAPALVVQSPPPPAPVAAPTPTPAPPPAPNYAGFDRLKLQAIFYSVKHPSVLINGQMAGLNEALAEFRVLDISPSSVTLEYQHQRKTLNLQ
jgi:putative nucleotidyltransferase with HDIG domain